MDASNGKGKDVASLSSEGAPPSRSSRCRGSASSPAKRHCRGADPASSTVPPPQGAPEEDLRIRCRTTPSGKCWFKCPICPNLPEMNNRIDVIVHSLRMAVEKHRGLVDQEKVFDVDEDEEEEEEEEPGAGAGEDGDE